MGDPAGLDLHLELSTTRPGRSLEDGLRDAIVAGRVRRGTRLPAARALAADLGIGRNTVADVYAQLAAEGWLESRVGAGTWVSVTAPAAGPDAAAATERHPGGIELRAGYPDPTGFPRREWVAAVRGATLDLPTVGLGYPEPAGTSRLRQALAGYVARTRGVVATADGVVVGHSFGDLLALVCRALRARDASRVAVEDHGHPAHRALVVAAGLEPVPIPVDEDGADVSLLDDLDVAAVLVTPAHQFPMGVPLSAERRRRLVAWAERTDGLVLEDDYDGEFRFDRRTIGALQGLAPDRVAYFGTASKALAPAVGIAWAVLPARLRRDVVGLCALTGGRPAALQQHALAAFVESHAYDRNVRRLRATYRTRRARLEDAVAALPGCVVTGLPAGLQGLLRLDADETRVEQAADRLGLRVEGLGRFRADGAAGRAGAALVVGYGGPTPGQYDEALRLLVRSVRAARG